MLVDRILHLGHIFLYRIIANEKMEMNEYTYDNDSNEEQRYNFNPIVTMTNSMKRHVCIPRIQVNRNRCTFFATSILD